MEAASATVGPARPRGLDRARDLLSRYGLIAALLFLPVLFAMGDLLGWQSKEFLKFSTEGNLAQLGNNLLDGLSNGAIWALVALGYTLVYGIVELINFAHGEVFMIGSFVAAGLFGTLGLTAATGAIGLILGLTLTLMVCMVASGSLNTMIERVGYRPLRDAPKLAPLITAVGFSFILQNVGLLWLGGAPQGVPDLISSQEQFADILGDLGHQWRRAGDRGHRAAAPLARLVREHQPDRQGDARHGAGSRGRAADGHQRGHHDLLHVPAGWPAWRAPRA